MNNKPLNILIIGGTGKTGLELIKQGLEKGYIITALVKDPNKLKLNHSNLRKVKGDTLKPESFGATFQGQDAVLSALGHKKFFIKTTILSKGTENIIAEMNKHSIKRFICITSLGINDSRFKLGLYYTLFVIPVIIYFYFLDKAKQEKIIMESNLEWTIIRPGQLTNGKKRMKYKHGLELGHYIFTKIISRSNVAHFMLRQLEDKTYLRKAVGVTY